MSSILKFNLLVQDPAGGKRTFEIRSGTTLIGRQAGVALQLDQQKISRQHAKIECDDHECILTDLASSNGTRLNGKKLQPEVGYHLDHGAIITIGDYTLVVEQTRVEVPETIARVDSFVDVIPIPSAPEEAQPSLTPEVEKPVSDGSGTAEQPPIQPPLPPGLDGYTLPGSNGRSQFLIYYLPEFYRTDFMECFLGLFESILLPVEWNIDNFDLYLSPGTSPAFFLPWLENWFGLDFDATWSVAQRRALLTEAHQLFAMRGTRWALSRLLEIYTGQKPVINDTGKELQPHTFTVRITGKQFKASRKFIQKIIENNKPAHTAFMLEMED